MCELERGKASPTQTCNPASEHKWNGVCTARSSVSGLSLPRDDAAGTQAALDETAH